ncbi:MAG: hypothetical protein FWG92_01300 [Leptospirales bacterium]|nr:hypothetical protein [Leptospirales bacterium]
MKIKGMMTILLGLSLIFVSCSKKGESELRALINEMHDELIEYKKNMVRAVNAKEVADEIIRHNRKLIKFADALKQLGEKYPELNDEKYVEKYLNLTLIEEVYMEINPIREKYMGEPEVQEAYQKLNEEASLKDSGG